VKQLVGVAMLDEGAIGAMGLVSSIDRRGGGIGSPVPMAPPPSAFLSRPKKIWSARQYNARFRFNR